MYDGPERRNGIEVRLSQLIENKLDCDKVIKSEAVPKFKGRIRSAQEVGQVSFVLARVTPKDRVEPILYRIEDTIRKTDSACIALPGTVLILLTSIPDKATVNIVINRLKISTTRMNCKVRFSGLFIPYPVLDYHRIVTMLEDGLLQEYETGEAAAKECTLCSLHEYHTQLKGELSTRCYRRKE